MEVMFVEKVQENGQSQDSNETAQFSETGKKGVGVFFVRNCVILLEGEEESHIRVILSCCIDLSTF